MYIPTHRTPSQHEENTYSPRATFTEYLDASMTDAFADTLTGAGILGFESLAAQRAVREEALAAGNSLDTVDSLPDDLKPMTEEEWRNSEFYRKGMQFEKGMNRARLEVYANAYDKNKTRERTIARRQAGFWDGLAGFAFGIIGSAVDPMNFIPIPGTTGLSLARRAAIGAVENIAGEAVTNLVTTRQRQAAGIQPSSEELMLNYIFAGTIGSLMPVLGAGFKKGYTKVAGIVEERRGRIKATIEDERVSVQNLTDNAVNNVSAEQRAHIVTTVTDSFESAGRKNERFKQVDPYSDDVDVPTQMDIQQRSQAELFSGDAEGAKQFLEASRIPLEKDVVQQMTEESPAQLVYKEKTLNEKVDEISQLSEEERQFISDNENSDISDIIVSEKDMDTQNLLTGETLFEVADKQTENLKMGIQKAVEVVDNLNCT